MKIALVSPYDFAYPGGVVNHIMSLGNHLAQMGHEVKFIAPASSPITTLGDRFIHIGKPRAISVSGSVARVTISPWLSTKITELLEREKFDIVHLHEPLMPMMCTTVLRMSRTANVGTFHGLSDELQPKKIDYVFTTPDITTISATIHRPRPDGRYLTDHE